MSYHLPALLEQCPRAQKRVRLTWGHLGVLTVRNAWYISRVSILIVSRDNGKTQVWKLCNLGISLLAVPERVQPISWRHIFSYLGKPNSWTPSEVLAKAPRVRRPYSTIVDIRRSFENWVECAVQAVFGMQQHSALNTRTTSVQWMFTSSCA